MTTPLSGSHEFAVVRGTLQSMLVLVSFFLKKKGGVNTRNALYPEIPVKYAYLQYHHPSVVILSSYAVPKLQSDRSIVPTYLGTCRILRTLTESPPPPRSARG